MENEMVYAYLAGLVDGEGYIGATLTNYRNSITPVIRVNMCDKEGLELLQETFGGTGIKPGKINNPKWRDQFVWNVSGKGVIPILQTLKPHLRIKEKQAKEILKSSWERGPTRSLDPKEKELRIIIYENLREFNKRGK